MATKPSSFFRLITTFLVFQISVMGILLMAQDVEFNQRETSVIHLKALDILVSYERAINQLGNAIIHNPELTADFRDQFISLFANPEVGVFNDLDPESRLSRHFEAETYVNNLELSYPDGIVVTMNLNDAKVGFINDYGNERYYIDFQVEKQISGNYRDVQYNTSVVSLLFRIGFTRTGNEFRNFKILGIRETSSNLMPNFDQSIQELNSEKLIENEYDIIKQGIVSLLNDYVNYLSLIGSEKESEYDKNQYSRSFRSLFESDEIRIYNDLVPDPSDDFVSIDGYLDLLRIHYSSGITTLSITYDSILFSNVIWEEKNSFSVYVDIDKFFSGVFNSQESYRALIPLTFGISFKKNGRLFGDFRFRSIDTEAKDYYQVDPLTTLPTQEINPVTRKGIALTFSLSSGQVYLEDRNILYNNYYAADYNWTTIPEYYVDLGLGVRMSFNDFLSLETGLKMGQYSSTFQLNDNYQETEPSFDVNGDEFYRNEEIRYDSTFTYNLLSVPFNFEIITCRPGKFGFYLSIGAQLSYSFSGSYNCQGSWHYFGFYPNHPEVIQKLQIEELGFITLDDIDNKDHVKLNHLSYSLNASFGISIPVKYFTQITLGPEVGYGISNFTPSKEDSPVVLGVPEYKQPTYLLKYGIRLGLVVKL